MHPLAQVIEQTDPHKLQALQIQHCRQSHQHFATLTVQVQTMFSSLSGSDQLTVSKQNMAIQQVNKHNKIKSINFKFSKKTARQIN